jgi:hypothetical protein
VEDEETMSNFAMTSGSVKYIKTYEKMVQGTLGMVACTYELYSADSGQEARSFLDTKSVFRQLYYVVVETPEGNWGKDINGMYKE